MADRGEKRATLKTVAELTGLSLSTVSLSLRGGNNLKQETRDKVEAAARQVGYVPNRAGVRLRTGRTNVLALVLAADVNVLDYTRQLIQGIGAHVQGTAFHLSVIPEFQTSHPLASVRYILENRSADGVILTNTSARDPRVAFLMEAGIPFVSHGRTKFERSHAYLDFDAEAFVDLAVMRLIQTGRRKILLAAVDNGTTNYELIESDFRRIVADKGLDGEVGGSAAQLSVAARARAFGHELAARRDMPDGIVCNNELAALSIISGLQDKAMVLGRDYDLVCKQNTEILPTLYPKMDTVAEDLVASGARLAELLIDRVDGAEVAQLQVLQQPIMRWRST